MARNRNNKREIYEAGPRRSFNSASKLILIGLVLGLILGGIAYYFANKNNDSGETIISSETVESSLKEAKELTTLKYHYKNVASYENSQEFYGIKVPFTTKRFLYTYRGVINAGVNLDEASVKVDDVNKTIKVSLPEPKILSHEIDEDSVMFFDEKESAFNQLKLDDYSNFRAEEEKKMADEAIENGLLEEAKNKTKTAITEILNVNPKIETEYSIIVE